MASLILGSCASRATAPTSFTPDRADDPSSSDQSRAATTDLRPVDATTSTVATSSTTTTSTPTTTTPTTTTPTTTTPTTTTSTTTTSTTTTTEPPLDVFDPECVIRIDEEMSPRAVATARGVDATDLWLENGSIDLFGPGDLVDICPGNGRDDRSGAAAAFPDSAATDDALAQNVARQQVKLNELFADFGISDLAVDGISGPLTGQRLCAARIALGLDATIADMAPGSVEQAALLSATSLPTPDSSALGSPRWILIDRTCQTMFVGAGSELQFVFPTSTGSEGFETRDQDRSEAFRFNPALDNGGWHDSTEFPVGVDNPLNGNLYKPLYFDLGQAIHGANNVPPTPESKGCARLRVVDQEALVAWLGLDVITEETWRKPEMNVVINVQGKFVPRPS